MTVAAPPAILSRLKGIRRQGKGWVALCPAHQDAKHQSLSIAVADDGKTLLHCFTGCPAERIVEAVGMTLADLAAPSAMLPPPSGEPTVVATYDYRDASGTLLYQVVRYRPKTFRQRRPLPEGGWAWSLDGVRRVVYRLPDLAEHTRAVWVEGEKDADRLWSLGIPATTSAGGASAFQSAYMDQIADAAITDLIILPDNDAPGRAYAATIAEAARGKGLAVKVVSLPGVAPKGDVSDWLGAGHTVEELQVLLAAAPEAPDDGPRVMLVGEDASVTWPGLALVLTFRALHESSDGVHAELTVAIGGRDLHWGRLNLAATSSREQLVKKLDAQVKDVPWRDVLERSCRMTADAIRVGEPIVTLEPRLPVSGDRYLIERFLPLGIPTVLYGDGGVGKGFVALSMAIAAGLRADLPAGLRACAMARTLYLDWESTRDEQEERIALLSAGLGLTPPEITYRRMIRSLADDAAVLRKEIAQRGIGLVIVDSLAPACGAEPEGADAATRFYGALRSFGPVTALIIAHVSHATAMDKGKPGRPFGSVFVANLARSTWEIRRATEDDQADSVTLALYHRKVNRGRRHAAIGLTLTFSHDRVTLESADLAASAPELLQSLPLPSRVLRTLAAEGRPMMFEALAEALDDVRQASLKTTLYRLAKLGRVQKLAGIGWALTSEREQ